jgi:hypothetical protein
MFASRRQHHSGVLGIVTGGALHPVWDASFALLLLPAFPRIRLCTDRSTSVWHICPSLIVHFPSLPLFRRCWHCRWREFAPRLGCFFCAIKLLPAYPWIRLVTERSTSEWHFYPQLYFLPKASIWTLHTNMRGNTTEIIEVLFGSGELGPN